MTYESGNTLSVSYQVPGFIGNNHLDDNISGEHLSGLDLSLTVLDLDNVLRRYYDFQNEILHVAVLDHLLDIHFYFIFVTGICMNNIPLGLSVAS